MSVPLRVLLVEDSVDDAELVSLELKHGNFAPDILRVWKENEFNQALTASAWDIIISDYSLPDLDATRCLKMYQESGLDIPFILVSGTIGEEIAVLAMKSGAHDYIMKDRLARLVPAVKRELREAAIRKEHRDFTDHLRFLAFYDPVTRLPNKRQFLQESADCIRLALEEQRNFVLAYIEIENLNEVRTVLSQTDCDALIHQIGMRLSKDLKDYFSIGRIDENSFGMTLPEHHAGHVIGNIFDAPFVLEQFSLQMNQRIGLASFPSHGSNATELLQHAIVASTQARTQGKLYSLYDAAEDHSSPENLALLGELRHGIDNGELRLHYQPILDLRTKKVSSVEALIRWQHPIHGMLPPIRFLDPAERSNLIGPLTRWVIGAACKQRKAWLNAGIDIPIAVNLSVKNIQNPGISSFIQEICDELSVLPAKLCFEITESGIMTDPKEASHVLGKIRDMGSKIAVDDFGTGHSSLAYLKNLPVDIIKVDRTFIANMTEDARDFAIVRAVLDLADHFGHIVVAEGVETAESLTLLQEMNCPYAQGYFFDKPMEAEAITRKLSGNT
jgi:diguanylate cyclase